MTVHLIKLCVGVEEVAQLVEWRAKKAAAAKKSGNPFIQQHLTRNMPRRKDEVLDGGSLYWVIKGLVQVRQRIVALEPATRENGEPACALVFDPELVQTELQPRRAFQGWRYLETVDAPSDLGEGANAIDKLPPAMASELRDLGLI